MGFSCFCYLVREFPDPRNEWAAQIQRKKMLELRNKEAKRDRQWEKNWLPFVDNYRTFLTVSSAAGLLVSELQANFSFAHETKNVLTSRFPKSDEVKDRRCCHSLLPRNSGKPQQGAPVTILSRRDREIREVSAGMTVVS